MPRLRRGLGLFGRCDPPVVEKPLGPPGLDLPLQGPGFCACLYGAVENFHPIAGLTRPAIVLSPVLPGSQGALGGEPGVEAIQDIGVENVDAKSHELGAGDGNRTHVTSLEGWGSTIELHPRRDHQVSIVRKDGRRVKSGLFGVQGKRINILRSTQRKSRKGRERNANAAPKSPNGAALAKGFLGKSGESNGGIQQQAPCRRIVLRRLRTVASLATFALQGRCLGAVWGSVDAFALFRG